MVCNCLERQETESWTSAEFRNFVAGRKRSHLGKWIEQHFRWAGESARVTDTAESFRSSPANKKARL